LTQFAVYPMPGGRPGYIVEVQSRLLDALSTRVVIPLIPKAAAPAIPVKTLNPLFSIDGGEYVLMTQNMASVPNAQLRAPVGTLATQRDHIIRAIDALLSGV
jgi:toxin CcdB